MLQSLLHGCVLHHVVHIITAVFCDAVALTVVFNRKPAFFPGMDVLFTGEDELFVSLLNLLNPFPCVGLLLCECVIFIHLFTALSRTLFSLPTHGLFIIYAKTVIPFQQHSLICSCHIFRLAGGSDDNHLFLSFSRSLTGLSR